MQRLRHPPRPRRGGGAGRHRPSAEALGWTEAPIAGRIAACLAKNDLPTGTAYSAQALADAALADKKRAGGDITLVIPKRIGVCELKKVPVTELLPIIAAGLEG